ncbi:MAG: hypothetical protein PHI35_08855 [Victivallaceae bacterium]|nr:hypothetical protein [Victivallaceae bacterium]
MSNQTVPPRSRWFQKAGWGLFMHFLARETYAPMTCERWNAEVDAFDVDKLAAQLNELKVGYFYLTLGQNSGWFCSPNAAFDRITGRTGEGESHCSRRDLVADMAEALRPYHIPMMVYLPCHGPAADNQAMINLRSIPPWNFQLWSPRDRQYLLKYTDPDPRIKTFLRNWEAIIAEWSQRWGSNVHGWWFDGCYYKELLYDFPDAPNFASWAAAARRGNADSLFAANPGVFRNPIQISTCEDYTSGENNRPDLSCCAGESVNGSLYHILTYSGVNWCALPLRFSPEDVRDISCNILSGGGVITWDVPYNRADGSLSGEVMDLFRPLRDTWHDGFAKLGIDSRISRPAATDSPGITTVVLTNHGATVLNGELKVNGRQWAADYVLSAGETREIEVELTSGAPRLTVDFAGERRFFCYQTVKRWKMTPGKFTSIGGVADKGGVFATLEAAFDDKHVKVRGHIIEKKSERRIDPDFWRGSCIETFQTDAAGKVIQRFFPPVPDAKHGLALVNHEYELREETAWIMTETADGYDFEFTLPRTDRKEITIELKLSVRDNGYFRRQMLAGTDEPLNEPDGFGELY